MKKRIICIAMAARMMFAMCIMASAEYTGTQGPARTASTANQSFSFWIENYGASAYDPNSAYKDTLGKAYVSCTQNTVYWPPDGVILRVRNASRQYATEALAFGNGKANYLTYLDGQNYTGTKWLYGSISDPYGGPYSLAPKGVWRP